MNCTRQKCPGQSAWRPILLLRASHKGRPVRATFTELGLCERHKDEAEVSDFLSTSTWDKLVRFMREAGKPAPRRGLTRLDFENLLPPQITQGSSLDDPGEDLPF